METKCNRQVCLCVSAILILILMRVEVEPLTYDVFVSMHCELVEAGASARVHRQQLTASTPGSDESLKSLCKSPIHISNGVGVIQTL